MIIYPAIDLLDDHVVRLTQGDYQQREIFGTDPIVFAQSFSEQGATHLHVVDLNGARNGQQAQFDTIKKIVSATPLQVEVGGGIRTQAAVESYLDCGVSQVILGTIAAKDPQLTKELLRNYEEKIVIGVDAKQGMVAVDGWETRTERPARDFCQELVSWGCQRIIYTEIERDGTGLGINGPLYQDLQKIPGLAITASGGVAHVADIDTLAAIGIEGVIIGKALYNGSLSLREVLRRIGNPTKEGLR
ncbi:1-(5-phosphoribosyl)-5-[(5-phosphoribosylamino)methylideneamino]imidazole-4-carboxamide isomerase [Enterococcus sp. RIT-PI-f]|uniref:1-(5-phosphoribosyl)-5-[(5- phosphoribosylamino)methylideneamino]imidazole-4- carboxamide isomerase n=1 Tax=Enterococcus sp. RIT-PI-f TaxID=1690244 RepID=UPI0006B8EAC0|nr:1-(5-phosphoribosyl)-5-[(5-phosphoribosylamino)methylideneamino]imidazole-4-carboxamide isomerase [Enterococcus sp. RIT-PI-f]KPG69922.1 1-(5-phosphoribosyl)-5-[(5-phosphoribosylamino)methylideneamino] imidazole-4-carboxamide isomerase [Enterococcus sp. RIT-PI-f]